MDRLPCAILQLVSIGNNGVIAAGDVVTEDIAANTVAGGVTSKFIKIIGREP